MRHKRVEKKMKKIMWIDDYNNLNCFGVSNTQQKQEGIGIYQYIY